MRKVFQLIISLSIIIVTVFISGEEAIEAGVQRNREDNGVMLGEWQPPKSSGERGYFLTMKDFTPGKKLAVKIFLEQPGEIVTVKLIIEVPGKPDYTSEKTVQDGGQYDLSPQQAVILFELTEIPSYTVTKYFVEVNDISGKAPVVTSLRNPAEPSGLVEQFGLAVSNMAQTLRELPQTISFAILLKERDISKPLHTLVVANTKGEVLNTISMKGDLESPIWLPNDRILFVERRDNVYTLKVVSATLDEPSEFFGYPPKRGTEPHLASHGKSIVYRKGETIMSTNLSGTEFIPLIQDKPVDEILGVFADADPESYNLVFSAKQADENVPDLWSAKIQGTSVISVDRLPYDPHWFCLDQVQVHGELMLYEHLDKRKDESNKTRKVWNIYLSQSLQEEGTQITEDEYNDRYPAWSPDGTKIVFVSD